MQKKDKLLQSWKNTLWHIFSILCKWTEESWRTNGWSYESWDSNFSIFLTEFLVLHAFQVITSAAYLPSHRWFPQDKIMKSLDWKGQGASIPHSFKTLESKGELFWESLPSCDLSQSLLVLALRRFAVVVVGCNPWTASQDSAGHKTATVGSSHQAQLHQARPLTLTIHPWLLF